MLRLSKSSGCSRIGFVAVSSVLVFGGLTVANEVAVFRHVNVVPMTSETVLTDHEVLVRDGRIAGVGPSGTLTVPERARMIDGAGAYLMPGLADMHIHLDEGWAVDQLVMYVANGVTTVRDMAGSELLPPLRAEVTKGTRVGPTLLGTSPCVWGWEPAPSGLVAEHKKMGYQAQKINSYLSPRDFRFVMRQVKRHDLYSVCHIPFQVGLDGVVAEGMNEIAHVDELVFELGGLDRKDPRLRQMESEGECIMDAFDSKYGVNITAEELKSRVRAECVQIAAKLRAANITVCTTLTSDEFVRDKVQDAEAVWSRSYAAYYHKNFRDGMKSGSDRHLSGFRGKERYAGFLFEMTRVMLAELKAAGVFLVLGTDAGPWRIGTVPGFTFHDELRILTENGFTPYEAIVLGTVNAAEVDKSMKGKGDFGTIEIGKRADLILLDGSPLDDVAHIQRHRGVMVGGVWHSRKDLDRMLAKGR